MKFVLLLALFPLALSGNAWVQDEFLISFWVDPQVPAEELDERYAEVAGANFTGVLGFDGFPHLFPPNPTWVKAQLAACEKHNLKCIPNACETAAGPGANGSCVELDSPSLWGFQCFDEPGSGQFPSLGKWADSLKQRRPDKMFFFNLLPSYGFYSQDKFDQYVASFIDEVKPQVLSMDYYASFNEPQPTQQGTTTVDKLGTRAGIPFWNFFNAMPFNSHYDPSEAELRWQAMSSLAYGAKGIMYFCYWSPYKVFPKGGGIIVPRGDGDDYAMVKGPHYEHARRINSDILSFATRLLTATSTGVFYAEANSTVHNVTLPSESAVALISSGGSGSWSAWLVGQFELSDHRTAILLHNQDDMHNSWPTIVLSDKWTSMLEVDRVHATESPFLDDSPWEQGLQVSLQAGDARLFILQ